MIKNFFLSERPFKNFKNKAYCVQYYWSISKKIELFTISFFNGIQLGFYLFGIIGLEFSWNRKCDHAGVLIDIFILGMVFHHEIYDCRHWNYKLNRWETEEEVEEENRKYLISQEGER